LAAAKNCAEKAFPEVHFNTPLLCRAAKAQTLKRVSADNAAINRLKKAMS
jgi:hypothetical protein